MSILDKVLGNFLGTKSDRDLKEIQPYVNRILEIYPSVKNLSNDDLRNRSTELRKKVKGYVKEMEDEMAELREQSEASDLDIEEKEKIYDRIDKLEKEIDEKYEEILNDVLPEVFSIVKDTARRFTENETIEVTATDFDRDLAAEQDNVEIRGEKAVWFNTWIAGGNEVTWDMIHYDVQLDRGCCSALGTYRRDGYRGRENPCGHTSCFSECPYRERCSYRDGERLPCKSDSEWMGPIYQFHGLTVGCIDKHQPNSEGRRKAYNYDITFGTNNEFGFDYLRDNMALSRRISCSENIIMPLSMRLTPSLLMMPGHLLIISGPIPKGENQEFLALKPRVETIVEAQRKLVNQILADAKKFLQEGNSEKAGFNCSRHIRVCQRIKPSSNFSVKKETNHSC